MCVCKAPENTGGIQGKENSSKTVGGRVWGQALLALPSSRIELWGI